MKKRIALFASGEGSNVEKIIQYFSGHPSVEVAVVFCNRVDAPVIEKAVAAGISHITFTRKELYDNDVVLEHLLTSKIDLIALAGFLWLMPGKIIHAFQNKIVNIHPALLSVSPDKSTTNIYGGKGMYGINVHRAVIQNREKETGITIHYVNEHFDEGKIIYQASCNIDPADTPERLSQKVRELEHYHYPMIIEKLLVGKI